MDNSPNGYDNYIAYNGNPLEDPELNYKELTNERFETIESIVEALELTDEDFHNMLITLNKPTLLLYCKEYYDNLIYYDLFQHYYETLENLTVSRL